MQLSMWTIFEYLKEHGFTPMADISNGTCCIGHVRLSAHLDEEEETDTVVIRRNTEPHDRKIVRSVVSCGVDRIHVPNADMLDIYNCIAACFDFFNKWERRLLYALVGQNSLHDILEIGHDVFQRPMFIKSAGSLIYAITDKYDESVHVYWKRFMEIASSRTFDSDSVMGVSMNQEFQVAFLRTYPGLLKSPVYKGVVLHTNIWAGEKRVGEIIVLENGKKFNNGDPHIMHFFQKIITKYMLQNKEIYLSSSKEKHCFMDILDGKPYILSNFSHIRQALKWSDSDDLAVACFIDFSECVTPLLNDLNEHLSDVFEYSCFFIYSNLIFGIINVTKNGGYDNVAQNLKKSLGRKPLGGVLSYEFKNLEELSAHYIQCHDLLKEMSKENGRNLLTAYHAAIPYIKSQLCALPNIDCYSHPDLCRLHDIDKEHNSDYLQTLFNFLTFGCNYTDTANYMGLHRNTLLYRLSRIKEIIHCDINDIDSRKKLLFSFFLMKNFTLYS
ncbi:MAG: helix-turn-helix domain-containing protein [Synergistes jonesii]|uniref:PucR family transcriptional regulator n=1 Tax=Synergistes jonesii TaxID=2754 RepID=UPI002A750E56|nr:helix-turn-helix domain-containing protein [Synergistes jonesii]MDY2985699.1 helix-turn-helix domain-containing protein [Synergistes jonesii]